MKVTQEQSIKSVNNKVDIIMSFLGLSKNQTTTTTDQKQRQEGKQQPKQQLNQPNIIPATPTVVVDIHHPPRTNNTLKGQIRHTVLSTVYENQLIKEKRANSVVIKGLDHLDNEPLQQLVSHFLEAELGLNVEITHCKLLGRPARGKVQPILTVLPNVDEANRILSVAKSLRQSMNPYTAQCVYIGPNLTASEAQAEYQLRCRRRERAAQQRAQRDAAQNVITSDRIDEQSEQSEQLETLQLSSLDDQTTRITASCSMLTVSTVFTYQPISQVCQDISVNTNITTSSSSNHLAAAIPVTSYASEQQASA